MGFESPGRFSLLPTKLMAGFGPTLTPYEYDYVLTDVERAQLAEVQMFPWFDVKSHSFRHRFGAYRNGEIYADPRAMAISGYGMLPLGAPSGSAAMVPVEPIYSPNSPEGQPVQPPPPPIDPMIYGTSPADLPLDTPTPFQVTYYGAFEPGVLLTTAIVSSDNVWNETADVVESGPDRIATFADPLSGAPGIGYTVLKRASDGSFYTPYVAFTLD